MRRESQLNCHWTLLFNGHLHVVFDKEEQQRRSRNFPKFEH
jgi:hypothetical protein